MELIGAGIVGLILGLIFGYKIGYEAGLDDYRNYGPHR